MYLAENLKYLRKINSLSQEDLADKLGINRVNVGKWETGTAPRSDALEGLANFFKIPQADLLYKQLSPVSNTDTKPATFTSTTKDQKPDIHLKKNPTAEDIQEYVLALMALREKQMEERIVNNLIDRLKK